MPRRWLIAWIMVGLLFSTAHQMQQQNPDRPLRIVIRNLDGSPAEGVSVVIYDLERSGLDRQYAESDSDGIAYFTVFRGEHLVAFEGMYQGYFFVTPTQQNAGTRTVGEVGGFGVFLDPQSTDYEFLFTIALNDTGQLVPLYDLAESRELAPVPYTYDGVIGSEVMVNRAFVQIDLNRVPDAAATYAPTPTSPDAEPESFGFDDFLTTIFFIVALVAGGSVLAIMWYIVLSQNQKSKGVK